MISSVCSVLCPDDAHGYHDTLRARLARAAGSITATVALAACATCASGQVLYSTGFEPPAFTTTAGTPAGSINKQSTWATTSDTSAADGEAAYTIVNAPTITGPGGQETVWPYAGTQMLQSATTINTKATGNNALIDLYTDFTDRTSGNNIAYTQVEFYMPSVDSTLQGKSGLQVWDGKAGLADLAPSTTVDLYNDTSGNVDLTLTPQNKYGSAVTVTSAQYPTLLQRDTWTTLTLAMNYGTGGASVMVNGQVLLTAADAFDDTHTFFDAEFNDLTNVSDTMHSYMYWDNLNVYAGTTPAPGALPVASTGFAAMLYGARSLRRRNGTRSSSV
jgi:hypothetical protein